MEEFNGLGNAILDPPSPGVVSHQEFQGEVQVIGNQESRFVMAVFPDDDLSNHSFVMAQRD